ncbi:MAG TPA: envelope stress response membrane protein PspC [Thiotrichales bacterium]|nr:envelope stress response membrane protein PspC [Thiotrichales bacterium]
MNTTTPSPNRLYRDKEHGVIGGVCAGVAEYLGIRRGVVRLIAVLLLVFWTFPTLLIYLLGVAFLEEKPPQVTVAPEQEQFWHSVRRSPRQTLDEIGARMRETERRLQALEAYLTSRRFRLDREFEQIRD